MADFLGSDFVRVAVPLVAGVVAWFLNERRKRAWIEYDRKEEHYKQLLLRLKGFYVGRTDTAEKNAFIDHVNVCWLYCPDEVLRKAYAFLAMVGTGVKHNDADKERAVGEFVVAIRKDLLSRKITRRTALVPDDYRHLTAT